MILSDFESMWRDLLPLGRSAASGGYFRQPWTSPEREARAWFVAEAEARGLEVRRDGLGNLVAWWRPVGLDEATEAVLTGSHLDSVLDGGAYDGPLGVVSALAALDLLRSRGFEPDRPIGVGAFVEEEGSRFGIACLGSRLLTGATSWDQARELRDRDGVRLPDALAAEDLHGPGPGEGGLLDGVGCFVELHVEQGRDLVHRDVAVGVASAIWPHGRYRFDFAGEANHAGTTRMEDRRDPMLSYAMTALAANKQARTRGQRATFGRVDVRPNGTNAVPSHVTAWLDARAESGEELDALLTDVSRQAQERAERDGTSLKVTAESVSGEVRFDPDLAARIAAPGGWPVIPTMAGHDAGVLSASGIPTAMLFVRNPTGVSHSPAEHAETADCLAGVDALADTLALLAGGDR
ncbi:MAG TPA: allantoate amidohydrolase [Nocardioides sp.]|uniref:allantoate amidohydrolase n=1 Tax=Nocardioides sp. TaxID=35761 RepID=UPI002D7FB6E0|nr:allantoate amidohydrolase [Nocardioides sp.]HET6654175.1 allantoate amidohydrolase [Nocardioides sp.]